MAQEADHRASEVKFPPYRYLNVTVRVLEGLGLCYRANTNLYHPLMALPSYILV